MLNTKNDRHTESELFINRMHSMFKRTNKTLAGSKKDLLAKIKGAIDFYDAGYVVGWAFNEGAPDEKVNVAIALGKNCIGTGVADQFREDLKEAGIGEGAHGFKIKVTPVPADGVEYELKL